MQNEMPMIPTDRPICILIAAAALLLAGAVSAAGAGQHYLDLPAPRKLELPPQNWDGDQQPHTLSVVEWNRDGFRYWGWYGLNNGRGMGLARSHDLLHWTKYEANPLWLNARWPSVVKLAESGSEVLYLAITRDYDTPSSRIVLARSEDGIHLTEVRNLVDPVPNQRNQNPDLFHDPVSGAFYLTFYRGNDTDSFDLISKSGPHPMRLSQAPEKRLMHTTRTVAAPNLLYAAHGGPGGRGVYFLATEIYPGRYGEDKTKDWQVKVFASIRPDGPFTPTTDNPVQSGGRACLFQHEFDGKYYGYQSRIDHTREQWDMEVLVTDMPR